MTTYDGPWNPKANVPNLPLGTKMRINEDGEYVRNELRTPYNYDTDYVSRETCLECTGEGKTKQQFKDDADINVIVGRFLKTGEMPPTQEFVKNEDFVEAFDYQESMNLIVKGREQFMKLPSHVRTRFDNEPAKFMDFMADANNVHEMVRMGLAKANEIKKPVVEKPPEKE